MRDRNVLIPGLGVALALGAMARAGDVGLSLSPAGWGDKKLDLEDTPEGRQARRQREYDKRAAEPKILPERDRAALVKAEEKRKRKAAKRRADVGITKREDARNG